MEITENIQQIDSPPPRVALTLGNFDGLHLGHQDLIAEVVSQARRRQGVSVVFSFKNHPLEILAPQAAPPLITTLEEKAGLLEQLGIDIFLQHPFTRELARMPPEDFLRRMIYRYLQPEVIVVGRDYAFGKNRAGNPEVLRAFGELLGYEVLISEAIEAEGIRISSSIIRRDLQQGKVEEAGRFLGRNYSLAGVVAPGHGRGLGYSTANLSQVTKIIPGRGVYATWAHLNLDRPEDHLRCPSVTNIGYQPTYGKNELAIEAHLLDFSHNLHGQRLRLEFVARLRDEQTFPSPAALSKQISRDIQTARQILAQS